MLEAPASLDQGTYEPDPPTEDLELPEQDFTYLAGSTDRPWSQFLGRWRAMRPEIKRMLGSCDQDRPLRVLDVGSCHGFFSLQIAHWHPEADVVGIEGSVGIGNGTVGVQGTTEQILQTRAVQTHLRWIKKLGLPNCFVAAEVWDYYRILDLASKGTPVCDAMLTLSVVHHMDGVSVDQYAAEGLTRLQGFTDLMAKLLLLAQRHFIELPNQPWLKEQYEAYGTARGILDAAVKASGRRWRFKGPIYSAEWFGQRDVWVLEAEDPMPAVDVQSSPFPKLYRGDDIAAPMDETDYLDYQSALDMVGKVPVQAEERLAVEPLDGSGLPALGGENALENALIGQRSLLQFMDPGFLSLQGPTGPVSGDIGEALTVAPTALLVAHLALREAVGEAERVLRDVREQDAAGIPPARGAGIPAGVC